MVLHVFLTKSPVMFCKPSMSCHLHGSAFSCSGSCIEFQVRRSKAMKALPLTVKQRIKQQTHTNSKRYQSLKHSSGQMEAVMYHTIGAGHPCPYKAATCDRSPKKQDRTCTAFENPPLGNAGAAGHARVVRQCR